VRISKSTIDEVKMRIDVVEVVGDFVQLKKSGINYKGKSPFNEERTPSFFVFPRNQNWKDFSSGKAGDSIGFLMEYDGLSYTEAIAYLAQKYGVEVEYEDVEHEYKEEESIRESLLIVSNFAKEHFVSNLWNTDEGKRIGLSYFKERGFSEETINKFELGYSLDKWNDLLKTATGKGYKSEFLEKAGLIIHKEEGDKTYDRFRNRVIFPIHSHTGKPIAFGARIMVSDKKQPKYLNSPETEIYHKGKILYGIYQARQSIRKEENCYLVEGYTDVISMHQCGVENVVSSSGTALTEEQVRLIGRHTENITVLFDGDEAGIRASLRGIDIILEQGLNVRAIVFPESEDPDSYARKYGAFNFREFLKDNEQDFIAFKTNLLSKGAGNDPIKKSEIINSIVQSIAKIPDPVKRSVYLTETSSQLKIDEGVLVAEMNKILLQRKRGKQRPSTQNQTGSIEPVVDLTEESAPQPKAPEIDPLELQERESIRLLISYGFNEIEEKYQLYHHYFEELEEIEFQHPAYSKIFEIFKEQVAQGNVPTTEYFMHHCPPDIVKTVIDMTSSPYALSENWERYKIMVPRETDLINNSVYTNILRLKFRLIKKMILKNNEALKAEKDPEKQIELMKVTQELKKAEMEYARPLGIVIS